MSKQTFTKALGQGFSLGAFIRKQLKLVCSVTQHSLAVIDVFSICCFNLHGSGHFISIGNINNIFHVALFMADTFVCLFSSVGKE